MWQEELYGTNIMSHIEKAEVLNPFFKGVFTVVDDDAYHNLPQYIQ